MGGSQYQSCVGYSTFSRDLEPPLDEIPVFFRIESIGLEFFWLLVASFAGHELGLTIGLSSIVDMEVDGM